MQVEVAKVQAEENAKAQIAIANIQAANERANRRMEIASQNQLAIANKMIDQADATSGVKTFAANMSDLGCAALWFTGTPDDFGVCGAGDQLRETMANDLAQSMQVFNTAPERYLGTIADPGQLALSKDLQSEFGRINTIGAQDGQSLGSKILGGVIEEGVRQMFDSGSKAKPEPRYDEWSEDEVRPTPDAIAATDELLGGADRLFELKRWEQDLIPLAASDPFIQQKLDEIQLEISRLE